MKMPLLDESGSWIFLFFLSPGVELTIVRGFALLQFNMKGVKFSGPLKLMFLARGQGFVMNCTSGTWLRKQ